MPDKLTALLRLLIDRTAANAVMWEYFSEDNMYRTKIGTAFFRISREYVPCPIDPEGPPEYRDALDCIYTIWISDYSEMQRDEFVIRSDDAAFAITNELFSALPRAVRDSNGVIDKMIRVLSDGSEVDGIPY